MQLVINGLESVINGLTAVLLAMAAIVMAWWKGVLPKLLPSPERVWLTLANVCKKQPPCSAERFRFVLTWLDRDPSGDATHRIEDAFKSVEGVELYRSARVVTGPGAKDEYLKQVQRGARKVLNCWRADLAIVGSADRLSGTLSLWYVQRVEHPDLHRAYGRRVTEYKLDKETLENHEGLSALLTVTALNALVACAEQERRALTSAIEPAIAKAQKVLEGDTITKAKHRGDLRVALGYTFQHLVDRREDSESLEKAVKAYQKALEEFAKEGGPLDRAMTWSALGSALWDRAENRKGLREAAHAFQTAVQEFGRAEEAGLLEESVGLDVALGSLGLVLEEFDDPRGPKVRKLACWAMTKRQGAEQVARVLQIMMEAVGIEPTSARLGARDIRA